MRIVVFGGAGDVGSRAVEELAAAPDVTEVTVADRDLERAYRLAGSLGSARARVRAVAVDAEDPSAVAQAMRGHDACASALGPFYRFEPTLVRAALEAGVDYASVCDEWDATESVRDAFDARARELGRTALLGLGTSPGVTNVGVRHLSADMDVLERARVAVYQPLDAGGGDAVIRHMLHIMTGEVPSWRAGAREALPACSETCVVEMPRFGPIRLWNMGHAEPVTLPRAFPTLREVDFYMGYGRGSRALVAPSRLGVFRSRGATELAVRLLSAMSRLGGEHPPADGAVRIDVWGQADGRPVHRMACGIGGMRETTGVSLAIGTLALARGELKARGGVLAPEDCLEPGSFVHALAERGVRAYRDVAMTRPLVA